jgi:hypothetical protein
MYACVCSGKVKGERGTDLTLAMTFKRQIKNVRCLPKLIEQK